MRIQKVRIVNYRSIKELEFDMNFYITILVGANESGKSNILKALTKLNLSDQYSFEDDDVTRLNNNNQNYPEISAKYILSIDEQLEFENLIDNYINEKQVLNEKETKQISKFKKVHSIQITKRFPNEISIFLNDVFLPHYGLKEMHLQSIIDIVVNFIRPIIFYSHKDISFLNKITKIEDFLKNPENYTTLNNLLKLGGFVDLNLFNDGFKTNSKLKTVSRRINTIFPQWWSQDKSIEFDLRYDHLKNLNIHITDSISSEEFPESRSEGVQWFMSFLINFLSETSYSDQKGSILMFDEFALHIHPRGQKDLLRLLNNFSETNQIIYTTHFPFLLDQDHPERIFLVTKESNKNNFGTNVNSKPYIEIWQNLRSEIGLLFSDSFLFTDKTLIVEGASEIFYLRAVNNFFRKINKINFTASQIILYPREGKGFNFLQAIYFCKSLELKTAILVDGDEQLKHTLKLVEKFEDYDINNVINLGEFFTDSRLVTIEDAVPRELYFMALNSYYSKIFPNWVNVSIQDIELIVNEKFIDRIIEHCRSIKNFGNFDKVGVFREINVIMDKYDSNLLYEQYKMHWEVIEKLLIKIINLYKNE